MITAREASHGIFGAWQFAKFDAHGLTFFDNTVVAFWRSFYAALIVLPAYIILALLQLTDKEVTAGPFSVLVIESIAYVIGWVAFPLAAFYLARAMDRDQWYCRYIVAYNWAAVLQIALFVVVTAVAASGMFPMVLAATLTFVASIAILAYQWFIARTCLEISAGAACGFVFLDLVISVLLSGYTEKLLHP